MDAAVARIYVLCPPSWYGPKTICPVAETVNKNCQSVTAVEPQTAASVLSALRLVSLKAHEIARLVAPLKIEVVVVGYEQLFPVVCEPLKYIAGPSGP